MLRSAGDFPSDFEATTVTPNGMLLVAGQGIADDNGDRTPELGVMDPKEFFRRASSMRFSIASCGFCPDEVAITSASCAVGVSTL